MSKKVYFDKSNYGGWFVKGDLEDYYLFKSVNIMTNEVTEYILSWTRNQKVEDDVVRVYDVEIDGEKYLFNFYNEGDRYEIYSADSRSLQKLMDDKSLVFVGETYED